ncbi:MAG TPA: hypothetical protein VJP07_03780 [Dehalococcoidia bacterium]|nr:hypothetical protein [Dehalococcoidia bacterium]
MKPKIGVMGSCSEPIRDYARRKAYELGEAIADQDGILITGASPGLPYEAVLGAKARGGMTVGISPGLSLAEHVAKYDSPCQGFDVLIYTGSGLMGREVENIRSSDIVVIVGGRSGTLGEFAIAYDEGKLIGVVRGTGGIADEVQMLAKICEKETGGHIIYGTEPAALLRDLLTYYRTVHCSHPSCFG